MTQAVGKSNVKKAARMLRHARPRSRWLDGVPGATMRVLDEMGMGASTYGPAGPILCGLVISLYISAILVLLVMEMPMILVALLAAISLFPAYIGSFLVYDEAERRDAEIHREGITLVRDDVDRGVDGSLLFPTDRDLEEWHRFVSTSHPMIVRNATMRLAALLELTTGHEETRRRHEVGGGAQRVLASMRQLPAPAIATSSKSDRRIMERIVGGVVLETLAMKTGDSHADEIALVALEALAENPDLVDAHGGRIDCLVNVELPKLVAERDAAMRHATEADARSALANYACGISAIERSVAEALETWQAARADALATRVRFLSQRRGDEFNLVEAAVDRQHVDADSPEPDAVIGQTRIEA